MTHLMNSGVMPISGTYKMSPITIEEYRSMVISAVNSGNYESSIGYPDNVRIIEQITGCRIPLSRKETILKDGDTMLIMKLKYRTNGYKKGAVSLEDFEFFISKYSAQ